MEDPIGINLSVLTELDQHIITLLPQIVTKPAVEAPDIRYDYVTPAFGSLMMDGLKRSQRLASRAIDPFDVQIHRLSVKKTFYKRGDDAKVEKKITIFIFKCDKRAELRRDQKAKIIRSSMYVKKEKFDASGKFVKLKARLVAGDNGQDRLIYGDISFPMVRLESVMIIAIASAEERNRESSDIVVAFIHFLVLVNALVSLLT